MGRRMLRHHHRVPDTLLDIGADGLLSDRINITARSLGLRTDDQNTVADSYRAVLPLRIAHTDLASPTGDYNSVPHA